MFRRLFYPLVLPAFLVSTTVINCAPVAVQQTTLKNMYTDVRADVVTTVELSQMTQQVLRMQGLQVAAQEPQRAFQDLDARSARQPDDQQVALAEIALLNAMHNESSNPTTTADWYLLAAARSYDFIVARSPGSPLFDQRYERMRVFYLRAVVGLVQQLKSASGSFAAEMDFEGLANRHRRFGLGRADCPLGSCRHGPSLNGTGSRADLKTAPAAGRPPQLMRIDQSCGVLASSSGFCSSRVRFCPWLPTVHSGGVSDRSQ
jgi:hypothetical protein